MTAANWSELLPELVIEIAKNFTLVSDQINFANVCSSWQSAIVVSELEDFFISPPRFPYLLLIEKPENPDDLNDDYVREEEVWPASPVREFFVPTVDGEGKIYKTLLPEASKKHCRSSDGWLFTIADDVNATLLHPFNRRQIPLPRLDTFPSHPTTLSQPESRFAVYKVVFSSNPSLTDDFFVMVVWGNPRRAGYCKPGFKSWIEIPWKWNESMADDITYQNGRMYVACLHHKDFFEICSCEMVDDESRIILGRDMKILVEFIEGINIKACVWYLVGGFDDDKLLFVVLKLHFSYFFNHDADRTRGFEVIEINLKDDKWMKVESLGDRSLFLGSNASVSVEADGCIIKPNCIYFTEEEGGKDLGIYHLSDVMEWLSHTSKAIHLAIFVRLFGLFLVSERGSCNLFWFLLSSNNVCIVVLPSTCV